MAMNYNLRKIQAINEVGNITTILGSFTGKPTTIEELGHYSISTLDTTSQVPVSQGFQVVIPLTDKNHDITQFMKSYIEIDFEVELALINESEIVGWDVSKAFYNGDALYKDKPYFFHELHRNVFTFFGFKNATDAIQRYELWHKQKIIAGTNNNNAQLESYLYNVMKPKSEKQNRGGTYSLWPDVWNHDEAVCGTYLSINDIHKQFATNNGKLFLNFPLIIPFDNILPLQAFSDFPNGIFGDLQLVIYLSADAMVMAACDPEKTLAEAPTIEGNWRVQYEYMNEVGGVKLKDQYLPRGQQSQTKDVYSHPDFDIKSKVATDKGGGATKETVTDADVDTWYLTNLGNGIPSKVYGSDGNLIIPESRKEYFNHHREFIQISNPCPFISFVSMYNSYDWHQRNFFTYDDYKLQSMYVINTFIQFRPINVIARHVYSIIHGFKIKPDVLQRLAAFYSTNAFTVPSEIVRVYYFNTPPTSAGLNASTQAPFTHVKEIIVLFPRRAGDVTCYKNINYQNLQLQVLDRVFPNKFVDTTSHNFFRMQIQAANLDSILECTDEFQDSYIKPIPTVVNTMAHTDSTGNWTEYFETRLRASTDQTSFQFIIPTEQQTNAYFSVGLNSSSPVTVNLYGNPKEGQKNDIYYLTNESYDPAQLNEKTNKCSPILCLVSDTFWMFRSRDGGECVYEINDDWNSFFTKNYPNYNPAQVAAVSEATGVPAPVSAPGQ
jgi:hypothetical protein